MLDDKLREIYNSVGESYYWEGVTGSPAEEDGSVVEMRNEFVAQIHQAYKEAGYVPTPQIYRDVEATLPHIDTGNLMTGQEWYSKLSKQLDKYDWTRDEKDSILQAAFEVIHGQG